MINIFVLNDSPDTKLTHRTHTPVTKKKMTVDTIGQDPFNNHGRKSFVDPVKFFLATIKTR